MTSEIALFLLQDGLINAAIYAVLALGKRYETSVK